MIKFIIKFFNIITLFYLYQYLMQQQAQSFNIFVFIKLNVANLYTFFS